MSSSYQVVLWKQESFVVLRPLQIEFFRNLLGANVLDHESLSGMATKGVEKSLILHELGRASPTTVGRASEITISLFDKSMLSIATNIPTRHRHPESSQT
jgi:hypothetical protein